MCLLAESKTSDESKRDADASVCVENHKVDTEQMAVEAGVASSILHAHESGSLSERDLPLLPWARAMVEYAKIVSVVCLLQILHEQLITSTLQDALKREERSEADRTRLDELSAFLQVEKVRVDVIVAQQLAQENEAMRLQLEREKIRKTQYEAMMRNAPKVGSHHLEKQDEDHMY